MDALTLSIKGFFFPPFPAGLRDLKNACSWSWFRSIKMPANVFAHKMTVKQALSYNMIEILGVYSTQEVQASVYREV